MFVLIPGQITPPPESEDNTELPNGSGTTRTGRRVLVANESSKADTNGVPTIVGGL